jgi:hypothetical protein
LQAVRQTWTYSVVDSFSFSDSTGVTVLDGGVVAVNSRDVSDGIANVDERDAVVDTPETSDAEDSLLSLVGRLDPVLDERADWMYEGRLLLEDLLGWLEAEEMPELMYGGEVDDEDGEVSSRSVLVLLTGLVRSVETDLLGVAG